MTAALKPMASNLHPIDHGAAIGHVHLKVSDLNLHWIFISACWVSI
jgi:hypothetical protein